LQALVPQWVVVWSKWLAFPLIATGILLRALCTCLHFHKHNISSSNYFHKLIQPASLFSIYFLSVFAWLCLEIPLSFHFNIYITELDYDWSEGITSAVIILYTAVYSFIAFFTARKLENQFFVKLEIISIVSILVFTEALIVALRTAFDDDEELCERILGYIYTSLSFSIFWMTTITPLIEFQLTKKRLKCEAEDQSSSESNISISISTPTSNDDSSRVTPAEEMVKIDSTPKETDGKSSPNPHPTPPIKGTGFYQVLKDPVLKMEFEQFLSKEMCLENLQFWEAVNKFKEMETEEELCQESTRIVKEFIGPRSVTPVNISGEILNNIMALYQAKRVEKSMFDDAQKQVFKFLKIDSYWRFRYLQHSDKSNNSLILEDPT